MNKRIVIKIGSDTITAKNELNYKRIKSLSKEILELSKLGYEILLVSSGAVAAGMKKISQKQKAQTIAEKRILAAIGQCYLIEAWINALNPVLAAQILLTIKEINDEESSLKAKETIFGLFEKGIIPIINENDAIADEEIRFTDNDQLAVKLAKLINADRLVILTNVDGLFTEDPRHNQNAKLIKEVTKINASLLSKIGESSSDFGSGGMFSKVLAAAEAQKSGIVTDIINGTKSCNLYSLVAEDNFVGTRFQKVKVDSKPK